MGLLLISFLVLLMLGVPIFIALAGSSLLYTHFLTGIPDFVVLHRMAGGVDSFPLLAVPFFILAGNLMNSAGITNRIFDFAIAARRMAARRARPRQRCRLGDLRWHVGHGRGRCRRARHDRNQSHARPWLQDRVLCRHYRGLVDHRAHYSAITADGYFRRHGERFDRAALCRGDRSRSARGALVDDLHELVCAPLRHRARSSLQAEDPRPHLRIGRASDDDARHHHRRNELRHLYADRGRDCCVRMGSAARHGPLPVTFLEALLQDLDGHYRDDGSGADHRRRGFAVRLGADRHAGDTGRHRPVAVHFA